MLSRKKGPIEIAKYEYNDYFKDLFNAFDTSNLEQIKAWGTGGFSLTKENTTNSEKPNDPESIRFDLIE